MNDTFKEKNWSKYHRDTPIKSFDLNQTMYDLIHNENNNNLDMNAIGFFGNNITYGELFSSSDKMASAFYNCGVREGDTVAICTVSTPIVQQILLSLSKIGAHMAWIDLRTKEKDLIKYINNCNCKTIVVFDEILPLIQGIINETDLKNVIVSSPKDYLSPLVRILSVIKDRKDGKKIIVPNDNRFVKYSDFLNSATSNISLTPVSFEKERPSLIVQSSGSTGKAKQIVHTEYNFNSAVQKLAFTDLPLYRGDTMHISVPPFIIYGLGNSIYSSMAFSMKAEMNPFVDEKTVYDDLGKFDIPFAAPLHYRYIYNKLEQLNNEIEQLENDNSLYAKKELKHKYKELKRVLDGIERANVFVSGGDKISSEELIRMQQKFDKIIVNGYGNNEVLGAAVVSPIYANRPGSIGVPMRGVDVKIVDPNTDKELVMHETGELYISTDSFVEYLNNEEETKKIKVKDENGKEWVKTGDLCYMDDDGFIYPKGRTRRLIKKEAFKICPDTIEEAISSLPFVKECVVVGVDDEKSISVPMAFIVINDYNDLSENELIEFIKNRCSDELPDYEVPTYYQIVTNLPYTSNNKYDFKVLEQMGNQIVKSNNKTRIIKK